MKKEKRFAVIDTFLMRLTNVLLTGYSKGWEPIIQITEGERFVGIITSKRTQGLHGLICDLTRDIEFMEAQTVPYADEAKHKEAIAHLGMQQALVRMFLWRQIIQDLDDPLLDNIEYGRIELRDGWKVVVLNYS